MVVRSGRRLHTSVNTIGLTRASFFFADVFCTLRRLPRSPRVYGARAAKQMQRRDSMGDMAGGSE